MIAKLISKFTEAGNAVSFVFEPQQPAEWMAGQYLQLELTFQGRKDEHWFTISSAPYEKHLQITTRLTGSRFKDALNALKEGDEVNIISIEGDFTWRDSHLPKVFIAGGIGITPFHSIIKQRAHDGQSLALTLLYANRDDKIPFKAELDRWDREHPELSIVYLTGQLSGELIKPHVPDLAKSLVYISGAESLIEVIGQKLINDFKLPKKQLIQDWFSGYNPEVA